MGNPVGVVGAKVTDHLPGRVDNVDEAVIAAEEQAIGAGAHTADVRDIQRSVIVFELDRVNLEEIKRFPLYDGMPGGETLATLFGLVRSQGGWGMVTDQEQSHCALRKPARGELSESQHQTLQTSRISWGSELDARRQRKIALRFTDLRS